jgi:endonuclease-8
VPEGDTIFRAARTLHQALAGKPVTRFETAVAHLQSAAGDAPVTGRTVERVEARGKWLLIHFSGDLILLTHMRMSGSWHIYRPGEPWQRPRRQMRALIATPDFEAVAFDVPVARFETARSLERQAAMPQLGPDLLSPQFAADDAAARLLLHPDREIGDALLDQRIMAGAGNVFKSEICFACGVHPFRRVASLTPAERDCLLHTARKFLLSNAREGADGAMVTWTGPRRTTRSSDPGARLWVYRRAGRPCRRCGAPILSRKQGSNARSTFWCPQCQPAPPGPPRAGVDRSETD